MGPEEIRRMIEEGIPGSQVTLQDLGGGDHWRAVVVAAAFAGKPLIEQHQMVYRALRMHDRIADQSIHALQLKTMVPPAAGQG